ncbi:hypothetical protein [Timonella sp. A28]|uniref:hypothetical protein n=1 Tax=Timonella sp. A28 TaxID=3442640 RepID=UPI003EBA0EA8
MTGFWTAVAAIIPSIGVGVLFYFAMRFIVRADRNERAQLAELDREEQTDEQKSPSSE